MSTANMTTHSHRSHTHERPHRHHYDAEMLSVEDARDRILSYFGPLESIDVPLLDALGLTLDEDLVAEFDIPPMANSAMDGYAVRSGDVASASKYNPVLLPVQGYIAAGDVPTDPVEQGTAFRIMTGAPVPEGADAVVPFEDTDEESKSEDGGVISDIGHTTERGTGRQYPTCRRRHPRRGDCCYQWRRIDAGSDRRGRFIRQDDGQGHTETRDCNRVHRR